MSFLSLYKIIALCYYVYMQVLSHWRVDNYITITKRQDVGYVSYHPELQTVCGEGETPAEAEANLIEATELAIQHLEESGLPVPMPRNFQSALVDLSYP